MQVMSDNQTIILAIFCLQPASGGFALSLGLILKN
jgi:hypothetical protein